MNKVVLALALFAGSASSTLYTPAAASQKFLFQQFVLEHGKVYGSPAEEAHRFAVFLANLKLADERNAAETGSATHGITKFMVGQSMLPR